MNEKKYHLLSGSSLVICASPASPRTLNVVNTTWVSYSPSSSTSAQTAPAWLAQCQTPVPAARKSSMTSLVSADRFCHNVAVGPRIAAGQLPASGVAEHKTMTIYRATRMERMDGRTGRARPRAAPAHAGRALRRADARVAQRRVPDLASRSKVPFASAALHRGSALGSRHTGRSSRQTVLCRSAAKALNSAGRIPRFFREQDRSTDLARCRVNVVKVYPVGYDESDEEGK